MQIPAVVLGAAVLKGGRPSPTLKRRTLTAVLLAKEGLASKLILSGGTGRFEPTEAEVMRCIANQEGIWDDNFILDICSTSTIDTARNCASIIHELGFKEAWIVTDSYHMCRSLLAFRAYGIAGKAVPASFALCPSTKLSMLKARAREFLACIWGAPLLLFLFLFGQEALDKLGKLSKLP
jgi:vancomycin permeability regulator SanA